MKNEVKIALVAIAGIVILFFGMKFLKGLTMFSTDDNYYAAFSDVSGLTVSSPVYANGYRVGVVEDVIYDYERPDRIVAVLGLDKNMRLPRASRVEIASDMLGNVKLELRLGPDRSDLLAPGDTIDGGIQGGLMAKAGDLVPEIERLLPKLDSILSSVNALMADPAIANSLHHIDQITSDLTTTSQQLNLLAGTLNQRMPQMMENADGLLANTNELTHTLNTLDIATTMASVNATLRNVEQFSASLNTLNLNATLTHVDSLLIDLKQHPKRYVHFSLFGKKDQ